MSVDNTCFMLFASCIAVEGESRGLLCDLQRGDIFLIPKSLIRILDLCKKDTIDKVKEKYTLEEVKLIDEYINFLYENELGFYCTKNDLTRFPDIILNWKSPSAITNAIIDINCNSDHPLKRIADELSELGCNALQIRYFSIIDQLELLSNLLHNFANSTLLCIELVIPFSSATKPKDLEILFEQHTRLNKIIVYSSPKSDLEKLNAANYNIKYNNNDSNSALSCGNISPLHFMSSLELFTESQNHNNCLNRKVSIDTHGNIKNCPSLSESYGNIKTKSILNAIENPTFRKYWKINKSQISICQRCEFRYVCTDCRAYIEEPENLLSKPLKCGYNPYTCEWEEWSTNPLKQKTIKHYGMQELISEPS